MKKCDYQVNNGDRCIGLDWHEEKKTCTLLRYMIIGIKPASKIDVGYAPYYHNERIALWENKIESSWAWNEGHLDVFFDDTQIFAYDKDLDDSYFSTINSIYGKVIGIHNVDLVKKDNVYHLHCGKDKGNFEVCKKEFNMLRKYIPISDLDTLKMQDTLTVKCQECDSFGGQPMGMYRLKKKLKEQGKSTEQIKEALSTLRKNYLYTHRVEDHFNKLYGNTMKGDNP